MDLEESGCQSLQGWLTIKRRDRCFAKCADFPNIADKTSSFFTGSKSFQVSNIKGHDYW